MNQHTDSLKTNLTVNRIFVPVFHAKLAFESHSSDM
jgi:hypothetical protein